MKIYNFWKKIRNQQQSISLQRIKDYRQRIGKLIHMFPKNYCYSNSQISISYSEITTISAIEHKRPKEITKLSIVHSKLESLEGIEKFTSLISLNLKYNNIENAQEIMRIPNKMLLKQLSIQGNSIQYFSACTYMSLRRNGFDSLILFNNKDYSKWVKKVKKVPHINKINEKLGEVQKQMSKTLKRTIRNNVIQKYKLSHQQLQPDQNEQTSRQQNSKQQTASSHQRTPFRQISLSNVNMIKSIRADHASPQQKTKIPQLVIEPIQFGLQDQIVNLPLTQPTATFASQKQKETMPFKGRGNHFATQVNVISEIDDQYECNYTSQDELNQLSYFRDNTNMRQSFSRTRQIGVHNKSALEELYESVHDKQMWIAECFYLNNLRVKALKALKPKNMPRRVSYV